MKDSNLTLQLVRSSTESVGQIKLKLSYQNSHQRRESRKTMFCYFFAHQIQYFSSHISLETETIVQQQQQLFLGSVL